MLAPNSVLRRLPVELDRKQALFFDGIRHAAEIAEFAHARLRRTLTEIALREEQPWSGEGLSTSAFLDAWSLVDVIDRFRALWLLLPHAVPDSLPAGTKTFSEIAQPIRALRNVADHLAQRAEYVLAQEGTALGVLSWCTVLEPDRTKAVICTIVPGTMQRRSVPGMNPAGRAMDLPTGLIQLTAGEHTACVSEVLAEMQIRVSSLEASLGEALRVQAAGLGHAGGDLLLKMHVAFPAPGEA
ncbi:MAG: hypothetical protein V4609_18410 [Pseudomonadota bacterium]